jgi:uncharacterized protein (TIGR02145 family)
MKNKIFVRIPLLLVLSIFIISSGCTKEHEKESGEAGNSEILQAYPGVHGEIVEFVINGDTITCEKINGEYVFQGDIILTEEQLFHSDTLKGAGSFAFLTKRWPNRMVYYLIDNTISDPSKILEAISEIEKNTSIRFYPHNSESHYIKFVLGDGYGSYTGMSRIPLGQKIILKKELVKGNILHEICHALGMIHEQSRWDRDDYVIVKYDNIFKDEWHNFEKIRNDFQTGFFDFSSRMLYSSKTSDASFAIDPKKPIITKNDGSKEGSEYASQEDHLSNGDIELLNKMYTDDFVVSLPQVKTYKVSNITLTGTIAGGKVTNDGNASVSDRGVYWGTSQNPETTGTKLPIDSGIGSFSATLSGLKPNTTYYVKAYAINSLGISYGEQVSFITSASSETNIIFNPNLTYGSVTDIDGNIYKTIRIGSQTWMAENLKTTKYNDKTNIPLPLTWMILTTPGYCKGTYGALYNWYAVDAASNGGKNVCPTGWHVPGDAEWTTLTTYLGGNNIAGNKLKETGTTHWLSAYLTSQVTNESGFTALPGGTRNGAGIYALTGLFGYWLSSSEVDATRAWVRNLSFAGGSVSAMTDSKNSGYSVRCVKDN